MKYKFYNEEKSVLVEALEWISLLEAIKEMNIVLEDDYTPPWGDDVRRRLTLTAYPIQKVIETELLSSALNKILDLVTIKKPNRYIPRFAYHTLNYSERNNIYGRPVFLGRINECYYGRTNYLPLKHFSGDNVSVIRDLIKLCDSKYFEIDWTPLMDEENDNAEG